jgi:hypothetical protein
MTSIRLRGPADIVATLPYQLGYHPSEAIVVVALRDRAIGFLQRLDLPAPEHVPDAVAALLPTLERETPDAVLLVGYEGEEGSARPLLDAMAAAADGAGLPVLDRLLVRDGRWFDLDCHQGCCPAAGTPVDDPAGSHAVAEFVGLEVAPLPDRSCVGAQLDTEQQLAGDVASAIRQLEAGSRGAAGRERRERGIRRWRTGLELWAMVFDVGAGCPPLEGLSAAEMARLAMSLRDVGLRDGLIAWMCPGALPLDLLEPALAEALGEVLPEPVWAGPVAGAQTVVAGRRLRSRLMQLCRAMPASEAPAMLTVLANLTWWQGDGALTRDAVDRALQLDPGYRLAQLLEHMVELAVRPRQSA